VIAMTEECIAELKAGIQPDKDTSDQA